MRCWRCGSTRSPQVLACRRHACGAQIQAETGSWEHLHYKCPSCGRETITAREMVN